MVSAALGPEDLLNLAFANKLTESREFVCWLLNRTKFADCAERAILLHEEQDAARQARFWWRHWWCTVPGLGDSETDIFLAFAVPEKPERFCLHIENKIINSTFTPNQAERYAARARYMLNNSKSAKLRCADFETVLLAPRLFREANRSRCDQFGSFIPHEDITIFVPEFGRTA
jgi:hypothetical protein